VVVVVVVVVVVAAAAVVPVKTMPLPRGDNSTKGLWTWNLRTVWKRCPCRHKVDLKCCMEKE
jgi:hypothetical protein